MCLYGLESESEHGYLFFWIKRTWVFVESKVGSVGFVTNCLFYCVWWLGFIFICIIYDINK